GYMYQTLTNSWQSDLDRPETTRRLGHERAELLYDTASPYDHPVVGSQSVETNVSQILVPLHAAVRASVSRPIHAGFAMSDLALTGLAERSLFEFDSEIRATFGSNNWVVDGSHTASGKPLLANDTHLALTTPDIWYLVQLSTPGWSAEGFTLPGVP